MAEILKEWLTHRLHTPIQWEAEEFGEKMKNGYIIACILSSYNVINDEKQYLIRSSNLNEDLRSNWKYLKEWLREIEINLSEDDIINIKNGKGSCILRLFYQLFLQLDKKDRTDFIKAERKMASNLIEKLGHRFSITSVNEDQQSDPECLSKPLINQKKFIEWQRKKSKEIKDTYDYIRHKYSKNLAKREDFKTPLCSVPNRSIKISETDMKDMRKFALKYPCKFENYSYEELLALEQNNNNRNKYVADNDWTKDYMDNLYTRMHKKDDSEEFQKQIMHVVSGSLWNSSIAEVESQLDLDLAKKVMKLSQFEKQMCTQIMETKQQARNLVQNRILAEKEFSNERKQQFNTFLDTLRDDMNSGLTEIDFEKQRQQILHKKLYAEKMKRKRQYYYEICHDTILSIIDYATKYAYFKRLIGDDIPNYLLHEWKSLFFKQQPIFDVLEPIDDLLINEEDEETNDVEDVIDLRLEKERQEALNENELLEYLNYIKPWSLYLLIPNFDPESEEKTYANLGERILGHVVYSLLEIKYPYPPQRMPADLPDFKSKALLRCLPDMSIAVAMQKLLDAQKIHVVRIESCINFCLRQYRHEMVGFVDIDLPFDKFTATAKEESTKELLKLMKSNDEFVNKSSESNLTPVTINTKQTQTPKTLPEDDIVLSNAANLGQYAYDTLAMGDSLTDHLIAAMIVEYLKGEIDINGFVIINYPNTYREAQVLEETFSGRAPPNENDLDDRDDIFLEDSISKHRKKIPDVYAEIRKSKLTNNPHKLLSEQPFSSYFTCYIKLKETEDILQEFFIWDLTKENSEFIDRFYSILGLNYSMYYETIEKEQLALICKYIIGDCRVPPTSYYKLFGENVLSDLDFPTSDNKGTKSKIIKPETSNSKLKDKLKRHSKVSQMSITNDLEIVKSLDSIEDIKNEKDSLTRANDVMNFEFESVDVINLLAGDEDWEYGKLPITEKIGIALASYWEEFEKNYVHDIQQLLLTKRLQMNCLVPYTTFIKDKMEQIITLPSRKQDIVFNFQNDYNNFENDWRDIHVTKNEWHCRIKHLQNVLYSICDERKQYAEHQKHLIVCENWTIEELASLANTYISLMQLELNRTFLTYQILHDFYFSMIKKMPPSDRLTSKELSKLLKETDETSGSKKGGEDKVYRQLKSAYLELQLKNIEVDNSNNPLNLVIDNNVKFVIKTIKDLNDSYRSIISREYSEIAKVVPTTKKKDDNISDDSVDSVEIYKNNALKCIEEWTMGINGEMFRCNQRILAIQAKCFEDMKLFSNHVLKTFMFIQDSINNYYLNEIQSVDRLCKYLQMAVEEGKKIPETLLLQGDSFIIDPSFLHFPKNDTQFSPEKLGESSNAFNFKISQLARLRNSFKIFAPTGIALQQSFIYALQDFIFFGKESCDGCLFPEVWRRVDPEQITKLTFLLYGETAYVDWRDFLIYCLNIRFPSVEELLELRKKFRCIDVESKEVIKKEEYMNIELWFENDFDNEQFQLRICLIKHFLFELFETSEDLMNYSAFLLAFCKCKDPKEGFANALSMAVGKRISYLLEECDDIVQKLIKEKKFRDECRRCAFKCAKMLLDKIIAHVVTTCEGTTIIELEYVEPPDKEKKGKKGKGVSKGKKIENSQSARIPKVQKSLTGRSKTIQSESDVKTTFICEPCEDEVDTVQEKPVEASEIKEEQIEEPYEDPNLQYAVPQSILWNVLSICLPWQFDLMPAEQHNVYMTQVKELLLRLEEDHDDKWIYVSRFLADPYICKILNKTKKFIALNLVDELVKVST